MFENAGAKPSVTVTRRVELCPTASVVKPASIMLCVTTAGSTTAPLPKLSFGFASKKSDSGKAEELKTKIEEAGGTVNLK